MRIFNMPFYFEEDERLVGGILSLKQLGYLILGVSSGLTVGFLIPLPLVLKILSGFPFFLLGAAFAFIRRVPGAMIPLDEYIKRRIKFSQRQKEFPFVKKGGEHAW